MNNNSWFDKKEHFYLEVKITYVKLQFFKKLGYTKKFIFATKSEEPINEWVKYISQGTVYTNYIEDKLKETVSKLGQDIESIENEQNSLLHDTQKAQEIIEIIDKLDNNMNPINNNFNAPLVNRNEKTSDYVSPDPQRKSPSKKGDNEAIRNFKSSDDYGNNSQNFEEVIKLKEQDRKDLDEINKFIDEKVNFKSFDIIKVLGSGAFGKVYKVFYCLCPGWYLNSTVRDSV